jgi:hypothetical protein
MSKIAGIALIVAGVAAGAYVLPTVTDSAGKETQVSAITAVPTLPKPGAVATSAPMPTLIVAPAPAPAVRNDVTKSGSIILPEVPQKTPIETGTVTTSAAQNVETPLPVPVARRLASAKPTDENARRQLTRDIQSELKRIGCYEGETSGEWTAATKKGMKAFIDRINATLPIEEPDHILKTLVQGHPGSACGKTCPAGQGLSGDRCVANAVLAQQQTVKRRVPNTRDVAPSTTTRETTVAQRPAAPTKPTSQWETTVTAMAPFALPAAPRAPAERLEPLAGRMALAGPAAGTTSESSSLSGSSSAKPAAKTEPFEKTNEQSSDRGPRSNKVAALPKTTDEDDDQSGRLAAKPKSEPKPETARSVSKSSTPAPSYSPPARPRVVVYSAPFYSAPPRRERSTFNTSVFAKLARDGR